MKTEHGVMVMKDNLGWGIVYQDGQSTSYGWLDPASAEIHDPRHCKKPTDVTNANNHGQIRMLSGSKLVWVKRITSLEVKGDVR